MIKQYIAVANDKWYILIYYNVNINDADAIMDTLLSLGCPYSSAKKSVNILTRHRNTGMTYTDTDNRFSFMCISLATSKAEMFNTVVHELKHVQSHICEYYDVKESSEEAAYLIGYMARRVYKVLQIFV